MTLKEEIIEMALDNFHYNDRKISIEQFADEVVSKFEERIDSSIPSFETPPDMDERVKYFHQGYVTGMRKVKEMLK